MRQFWFVVTFVFYLAVKQLFIEAANVLFFGWPWERLMPWFVAFTCFVMFYGMVARETRRYKPAQAPIPVTMTALWQNTLLLTGFIIVLALSSKDWYDYSRINAIASWFKVAYSLMQLCFWGVAGIWTKSLIEQVVTYRREHTRSAV